MKHTIEELQFAATVRELVAQRRSSATINMTKEEKDAYHKQPANEAVLEVLKELDGIAGVITKSREANHPGQKDDQGLL